MRCGVLFSLRDDVRTHVTARMNLDDVVLRDGNQTQEDEACVSPLRRGPGDDQSHRSREQWEPALGADGSVFPGDRVPGCGRWGWWHTVWTY